MLSIQGRVVEIKKTYLLDDLLNGELGDFFEFWGVDNG
jgi:hypothetical protein